MRDYLKGPDRFSGFQFHFHHGSEHTVDGKRHDLEMHTVHLPDDGPKNEIKYAALGIFFSVNDYTYTPTDDEQAIIDKFFTQLEWDKTASDPLVDLVSYGELMMMVDTDNRWVYKGSVTTPPCDTTVYWNVVRKIYPLKQEFLDLFKEQLKRGDIGQNYREIQKVDNHDLKVIYSAGNLEESNSGLHAALAIAIVFAVIFCFMFVCAMNRLQHYWAVAKTEGTEFSNFNTA